MRSPGEELTDAEVPALQRSLLFDQLSLLGVVIHGRDDGLGGEAVDALGSGGEMLTVGRGKLVAMACVRAAVE